MGTARLPTTSEITSNCWSASLVQSIVKRTRPPLGTWALRLMNHRFGQIIRFEPFVMEQATDPLAGRFLIPKATRQLRLCACLFINNGRHVGRDRFDLMPVRPR
jgi:hypothetical protein